MSEQAELFLGKLMTDLQSDPGKYRHKCNIPIEYFDIDASDMSDILMELLLVELPFDFNLRSTAAHYYLQIKPKFSIEKGGYYIYRYYVGDDLVYIGRTNRPAARYIEHCRKDKNFEDVTRIDIHKCLSKNDMIFLERLLISHFAPPWNKVDAYNGKLSYEVPDVEYTEYTPLEVMLYYE